MHFLKGKKSEVGGRHLVKNFPGSSRLQHITRCSLAKEESTTATLEMSCKPHCKNEITEAIVYLASRIT